MLHRIGRLACVVIVCSALALLAGPHAALASDQVVTDCGDSGGPNQLRAKLAAAQSSGGGTITFTCGPATIVLTGGVLPTITSNVTINGEGKITLSGNNASRLFFVDTGGGLALDGLALTKGYDAGSGGALYMYNSTLDANNVTFKDNRADIDGGALYAYSAVVNLTNVTFDHNQATDDGGGAYSAASIFALTHVTFTNNIAGDFSGALENDAGSVSWLYGSMSNNRAHIAGGLNTYNGTSELRQVTISDNTAIVDGGGIFNSLGGTLNLDQVTLSGNSTTGSNSLGGGIFTHGTATLINVTLSGNSTMDRGGGIYSDGTLTLTNVILSGNSARNGGGVFIDGGLATLTKVTLSGNSATTDGGGLYNLAGLATLTNVTLSGNTAGSRGGGLLNFDTATLTNVTLSGNSASYGGGIYWGSSLSDPLTLKNTLIAHGSKGENCVGVTGGSFNLSDDGSCSFGTGRDNVNLLLNPLANNGGLTPTHLPQPGSPAIDNAGGADCPPTDQRGFTRAGQGIACDVGAVERRPTDPSLAWRVHLPVVIR